jgi:lysophospholipid acyltransferase (LPLAT)-like uncharacterized protein
MDKLQKTSDSKCFTPSFISQIYGLFGTNVLHYYMRCQHDNMYYLSSPSSVIWSVIARGFNEFGFSLIRGSKGDEELSILSLNLICGR